MTLTKEQRQWYDKGYHAGYRHATIDHLGGKCADCDETDPYKLDIHHKHGLVRNSRRLTDWKDLSKLEVKCLAHHPDTTDFRRRRREKSVCVNAENAEQK
jgi:hypothetical protein